MSNPPEATNLTQKFAALAELMTTQHSALMNEITALRGTGGPETTLRSINQSIWNLAGTAPGASLAQILAAVNLIRGPVPAEGAPDTRIDLVQVAAAIAALGGGQTLQSLYGQWDGGTGISAYALLTNIYTALSGSGLSQTAIIDILTRLIAQFDTAVVTPTMKDLMLTINTGVATIAGNTADLLALVPPGICDTPFVSTSLAHVEISANLIEACTYAIWPDAVPLGYNITVASGGFVMGNHILQCDDWSQYRIYVASRASIFSAIDYNVQRLNTNEWITLAGNQDFSIHVPGDENLKVYICGSDPILGSCASGYSDPLIPSGWQPGAENVAWGRTIFYEMVGYNNGGTTWSLDITFPEAYGSGTWTQEAFRINTAGDNTISVTWTGGRDVGGETLHLRQHQLTGGGVWAWNNIHTFTGASGTENIAVPGGDGYAYSIIAIYTVDPAPDTLPTATFTICHYL